MRRPFRVVSDASGEPVLRKRRLTLTVTALTFSRLLAACSKVSEQKLTWTETVMLQDESAIPTLV